MPRYSTGTNRAVKVTLTLKSHDKSQSSFTAYFLPDNYSTFRNEQRLFQDNSQARILVGYCLLSPLR